MKKHIGNTGRVLEHLLNHKTISSKEAFELYGATRLSAIIFNLRQEGYYIENIPREGLNRFGEKVRYVDYELVGVINESN